MLKIKFVVILFLKMRKKLSYLLIGSCLSISLHAQKSRITISKEIVKTPNIKVAYLGSIIYPGFKIGAEFPMYAKETTITKKSSRVKVKLKERFVTGNLGFYYHKTFHANWMLSAEWQLRKTRQNGWFTEWASGLGYSRTVLDGTTYKVIESGEVTKIKLAGNHYFLMSIHGGFGYDFMLKKQMPFKLYFKGGLIAMAPYNSFMYPRPTVELGVITSVSNFTKRNR
jgi:hypothetical protein